jgi:translation initiation factor IF-2
VGILSGRRWFAKRAKKTKKGAVGSKAGALVYVPEGDVSLSQLAWLTQLPEARLAERLHKIGLADVGDLSPEAVQLIAQDLGLGTRPWAEMPLRAPIVTVMGHVDHGKTTLLDTLRKTSVAAGEAGAITQHIGAFSVQLDSSESAITFLDTPGHSAFEAMRERGAVVTDIVVLVVAADDGVQPQTIEAVKHATRAGVPVIVAVNKCDLEGVDPERILGELAGMAPFPVVVEQLGGDVMSVCISALHGTGMEELEEAILLQAELMELRADPNCWAEGVIVEARLDTGLGAVSTVLIKRGTLRVGDHFSAGQRCGKVKAMRSADGELRKEARPGEPVQVVGLKGVPDASDPLRGR